jgi:hypothetical protein
MMLGLLGDIASSLRHVRSADREASVASLPGKSGHALSLQPFGRTGFQIADQTCYASLSGQLEKDVNVVGDASDDHRRTLCVVQDGSQITIGRPGSRRNG